MGNKKITLGDEVRDPVTGCQGIAMARHTYLHGCDRIAIQPKIKEDGTLVEAYNFDEPQLEIINPKIIPEGDKRVGGPEKFSDNKR